jgi:hypothetical protein
MQLANGSCFGLDTAQLRMIRGIATSDDESTCERTMDWVDDEIRHRVGFPPQSTRRRITDCLSMSLLNALTQSYTQQLINNLDQTRRKAIVPVLMHEQTRTRTEPDTQSRSSSGRFASPPILSIPSRILSTLTVGLDGCQR